MSNEPNDDTCDPMQTNQVIEEAFKVADDEAVSESEEGASVEALSRSFESYIQNYQDSWQQAWQDSITAFEQEVESWQTTIGDFQDQTSQPQRTTPPAPEPPKAAPPTPKAKPQKARS